MPPKPRFGRRLFREPSIVANLPTSVFKPLTSWPTSYSTCAPKETLPPFASLATDLTGNLPRQ